MIEYGAFRVALSGDAGPQQFRWWSEHHPDLIQPVQVYKSSHHGSADGDDQLSMTMFSPEVVVIGVGAGNRYGHPTDEALALYDFIGATVLRTDLHGTVVITATLEGEYQVVTERGAPQEAKARAPPAEPTPTTALVAGCIDINTASKEALKEIIHVDEVRSAEVIELRQQRPFASVEELTRVSGIGPARLRDIKEQGLACVK